MKYVKRYLNRGGQWLCYFRKQGHARDGEALRSPWPTIGEGSELEVEVAAILGADAAKPRPRPTNLAGATRAYELSADFAPLAEETKQGYRYMLTEFDAGMGHLLLTAFTPSFIQQLRDEWAERGYRAANMRLQLLKNVLNPQLVALDLPDPFSRIKGVKRPRTAKTAHPIWPEWMVTLVIETAVAKGRYGVARAVAVGRYAGARRGDVVDITHAARQTRWPSNVRRIGWLTDKKRVTVDMKEDPRLTHWLDATPASQPPSRWQAHMQRKTGVVRLPPQTLVYNISNEPYTEDGLGQELAKIVVALHAAGKIDSDVYDLHGLRHSFGVELALAGATDAQGAALMGHSSPSTFAIYRKQADKLVMSDVGSDLVTALLERAGGTGVEQKVSADCL